MGEEVKSSEKNSRKSKRSKKWSPLARGLAYELSPTKFPEETVRKRLAWLNRPIFSPEILAVEANQIARAAPKGQKKRHARDKEKLRQGATRLLEHLRWQPDRLRSFMACVLAYWKKPSIQSYLKIRKEFPEVEVQGARFGDIEALYELREDFGAQGLDSGLIVGALDAIEPQVDALCLQILELLAFREALPRSGPGHIEKRRAAISDATIDYLVMSILQAYESSYCERRIPGSLIVLLRQRLTGEHPKLEEEYIERARRRSAAYYVGLRLPPNERLTVDKLKDMVGLSRPTAGRWLKNRDFLRLVESARVVISKHKNLFRC
jgi:hypothetical protein